ncbi:GNAT family N-acetyltransferase [Antarcticibacterium flavum]|uniref:GNAT family N-acetyltransferase n=1 Tax=Antarcticibacterium flavum TaxID=2058175 RepID=A0A5B7X663_9FLAO|nr:MULTISPECIES: GNAT family N-acetyltransferase [Antarcticibacterium]MCM4159623.1 GNAT family N-acetyltransferase [Antarcticibacterium sp. W02-3]QCY70869.1 GNAT family N-acetyltransferase [Antarcticibacterium flavum]
MNVEIIPFQNEYAGDFKELNIAWLEKYFWVEPHDEEVLGKPQQYILDPGGNIFFVKEGEKIIGTVALMKIEEGIFELTKMAITPAAQGKRIGQKLMEHCLNYAKEKGWEKLIIYSNRKLENAIHIYKKYGFKEIPIEGKNPYARGDIKLELPLY